jgi:16S rRNA (cytosine1407-C5)-methyltransferase
MKQDFLNYIKDTFGFSTEEMLNFSWALSKPLKKTIRINTNKISSTDFYEHSQKQNWVLTETSLGKNMFYIDREDISIALGHTLEHISGYFYVQELAASSSPFYLSGDTKNDENFTILDMSASPGGKTTQLAEYYPNSTIIANEIDKTRMKQLYENTDRLGAKNVFVTNYDGRFLRNYPEIFDIILLDAPCSGEGTAYKTDDALKYWNIKNIKRIAKLQTQLLESALIALKVWGEMVYSTCTLNRLENEEIIEHIIKKYGSHIEIIPLWEKQGFIRAWPHITGTGGFFVAKLRKVSSLSSLEKSWEWDFVWNERGNTQKKLQKHTQGFEKVSPTDEKEILRFLEETFALKLSWRFYTYRNEIYYTEKNIDFFWENFFLYKCGIKIGSFENGLFEPNYYLGVHFWLFQKNSLELSETEISTLLRGETIVASCLPIPTFPPKGKRSELQDGYYQVSYQNIRAGLVKVKNGTMMSLLETKFMRK